MANTSIYTAFERMWQHVVAALSKKQDKDFIITVDDVGIADKTWAEVYEAREVGRRIILNSLGTRYDYVGEGYDYSIFQHISTERIYEAHLYDWHQTVEFTDSPFVDLDGYYTQTETDEKLKESVADWNQNDETALDYVKNRPFYEDTKDLVIYVPEQKITFDYNGAAYLQYFEEVSLGDCFNVKFDNNIYEIEVVNGYLQGDSVLLSRFTTQEGNEIQIIWDSSYFVSCDEFIGTEHTIFVYQGEVVIKTIDPKFLPDNIQSDWNQNDEAALDYVKNRTHWEGEGKVVIVPETVGVFEGQANWNTIHVGDYENFNWTRGNVYFIKWDGIEYECVCEENGEACMEYTFVVNGKRFGFTEVGAIYDWNNATEEGETHTFEISEIGTVVHHLDPKYIKDMYYEEEIETILVDNLTFEQYDNGEYPKCNFVPDRIYSVIWNGTTYNNLKCYYDGSYNIIADESLGCPFYIDDDGGNGLFIEGATDEDDNALPFTVSIIEHYIAIHQLDPKFIPEDIGAQSDWNQNDPEAGDYIKNRTHWEEIVEDGVLFEGKVEGSADTFVDLGIQLDLKQDKQYKVIINDVEYTVESYWSDTDGDTLNFRDLGFNCQFHDCPDGHENSTIWTYEDISFTLKIIDPEKEGIKTVVHQLDPKYIKDLYYEDPTKEEINVLINTKVNIPSDGGYALLHNTLPMLIIGDTYIVTLNGTEYECTARVDPNHNNGALLGNGTIYGDGNIGNGEPFAIDSHENNTIYLNTESAGDYTVSISHLGYVIHKIDSKYLNNVMSSINPSGTGSFSLNRNPNSNIGANSVAHGYNTIASGSNTHAEGFNTTASGNVSHAEGGNTIASANFSHAEGYNTIAQRRTQHVQGEFNIPDTSGDRVSVKGSYIHIVGNGTADTARSNAHTIDWDGNAWYSGDVYVGSTSGTNRDEGSKKLATVDELTAALEGVSGFVAQAEEPEDTSVLWLDTDDNTDESESFCALTFTGGVEAMFDGTEPITIDIPKVAGDWRLLNIVETTEEITNILIDADSDGNAFECEEVLVITQNLIVPAAATQYFQLNKNNAYQVGGYNYFATSTNNSSRRLRARALDNLGAFEMDMYTQDGIKSFIQSNTAGWAGIPKNRFKINAVQLKATFSAGGKLWLYGR